MILSTKMRLRITKLRSIKCFLIVTLIAYSAYCLMMYTLLERTYIKNMTPTSVKLSNVVVHIDLKGTPLRLSYLEKLFPMMKRYGVNGILMEYEDMFPYEGRMVNLSAEYHYDKAELKQFLRSAKKSGFDIIPLVQTFGHLEYALKLEEFQHLREIPLYPDSICPSNMESMVFLHDMIKQVVDFHHEVSPLKYIHIGCDEVYHINHCKKCRERTEIIPEKDLLIQHIRSVSEIVNSLAMGTTILIWNDMLRGIKPYEWIEIEPFPNVQPVAWNYGTTLLVTHQNLYMYHKKFNGIWIASAFKGADGRTSSIPYFKYRFLNHLNWMGYIRGYRFGGEDTYNFEGIILTGWSRYSHMDPPCDLLPVSIPSLIINLIVVQKFITGIQDTNDTDTTERFFNNYINTELEKRYGCTVDYHALDFNGCKFQGHQLYNVIREYVQMNNEIATELIDEANSIVYIEYYSKSGNINMNNVLYNTGYLDRKLNELFLLENQTETEISKYYHKNFAREYVGFKSFQNKNKIMNLLNIYKNFTIARSWNKRTKSDFFNFNSINNTLR